MLRRMKRALRRHGMMKFSYLLAYNAVHGLRRWARRAPIDPAGQVLDEALGIETAKIVELSEMELGPRHLAEANRYQPSAVELVRRSIEDCRIDHSEFVFIDYGSGKGRVLLLAAQFPFRAIIGVEFSPELHQAAQRNIAAAIDKLTGCRALRAVLGDAADFEPPTAPLVCYFNNPFGEPIMRDVLSNIERCVPTAQRRVLAIYVNPVHRHVFEETGRWTLLKDTAQYAVYDHRTDRVCGIETPRRGEMCRSLSNGSGGADDL